MKWFFNKIQFFPKKPKVVVLCGSSRYIDVMAVCGWVIERDEHAICLGLHLLPGWYGAPPDHLAESEGVAEAMDALHLRKIDLADEVFVVNVGGYVGESTEREIRYALDHRKTIRWFTHDPVGTEVTGINEKFYASAHESTVPCD